LVERLLKAYPSAIAGMKDSSGDWNNTKTFLDAFAVRGFDVFVGSESFLLANMRNGGVGTISATANVNPAAIYQLYAEYNRQNCSGERRANRKALGTSASTTDLGTLQEKLNVVREVFARKSWPSMIAALKQAIAIYGNDPEWARVRPPLVELTAEQARKLVVELEKIEFNIKLVES
jgi:4-hydroxy-tetrahydrodipicolinate synthase